MQHFFVTPLQVKDNTIIIEDSDVNHMRNVLRMKPGEQLYVSDGNNRKYLCAVMEYGERHAVARILKEEIAEEELPSKIFLFQGLPKSDKMDLIIQKAVELGVHEVVPVMTKRSVVKLDDKKAEKKAERWREIAKSAAKQAGRGILPVISNVKTFKEALEYGKKMDILLIPYELAEGMKETRAIISSILPGQSIGVYIGPEGGFEKEEVEGAKAAGAQEITLGRRILRTETAGLTILSILMYHLEK